jgi:SNF2 family DNA or RNA helicase
VLKLEDIQKGATLTGIEPDQPVGVMSVDPVGADALTVVYRRADGQLAERMVFRSDEASLAIATIGRPWSFDAPAEGFKLAVEAYRIRLAHLFDPMMAVHTSDVEPLPHQIAAVYEAMLPRQPLRFVLADDPGAGKTIMAGLLVRELMIRSDAQRILIVAPGSLSGQWQDELREKFGLDFEVFSREMQDAIPGQNYFEVRDRVIARLDQLSRSDDLREKLQNSHWDLIIVDEAHKLSANYFGQKVNKTQRFTLGELLGGICRHFLLMTATPHNGKEEDFQLFLSLLDSDRFYGKFREGAHKVDVTDLMRRMVKEDLLKFDGTRLFPERFAYTANYDLSPAELSLYSRVTDYVRNEMNRADQLEGQRKGTVGFALTQLQRRLASSPEAIFQSLRRRRRRLEDRLAEEKAIAAGRAVRETVLSYSKKIEVPDDPYDADDDLSPDDYEAYTEQVVDQATASRTIAELEAEIFSLQSLEHEAHAVVQSGNDRKWEQLSRILQDQPEMRDTQGHRRKLIIFTEHRDTLNYLLRRIGDLLGQAEAVVTIHGGTNRDERRRIQEEFRQNKQVLVLVATDAAGEGVNLQNANLMINYDLPWNPNRIEQRFGRIHRIGQREVCHLWNLVANQTREGEVFRKLFDKIEIEKLALGGRVFDVLGEAFNERSLKDLLIEAIRYGERPDVKAKLNIAIDNTLDRERILEILKGTSEQVPRIVV